MGAANIAVNSPYQKAVAITASDAANISTGVADAVLCLTAGSAVILDAAGSAALTVPMTAGQLLPLRVVRINSTGTTGTYAALYLN